MLIGVSQLLMPYIYIYIYVHTFCIYIIYIYMLYIYVNVCIYIYVIGIHGFHGISRIKVNTYHIPIHGGDQFWFLTYMTCYDPMNAHQPII